MRPFNLFLGSEPLSKLTRGDERLDHFGVNEVAVELVEFVKPEVETIQVIIWRIIGITSQIAEILRQHKCPVEFTRAQRLVLSHPTQHSPARAARIAEFIDRRLTLGSAGRDNGVRIERIDILRRRLGQRIKRGELGSSCELIRVGYLC